jgi:Bacterial regulatory proteins, lacI family
MATIYDVAKRAEVSIATVSAVLNRTAYVSPELTKRVKLAVEEMDYTINHLAHSLQTRVTCTIGMLIPDVATPDPFYGQVVRGAPRTCSARKAIYFSWDIHTTKWRSSLATFPHSVRAWSTGSCCFKRREKTVNLTA